ncbi:C40 family peptidase [Paratissierella segnis]|uniref:C40 family peptidase n=1 Tax=Paratissierella segnis TaxID=2763679 RepID=A0A926IKD2_9FIRM|nr:C40 family peptidase [Paratissierella segnis]MBC8588361.1 C40 family peptidase [Paratissierella segnis]
MESKRHNLPMVVALLSIVLLLGFKDTGKFVKEYKAIKDDGTQIAFNKGDVVDVVKEREDSFLIQYGKEGIKIPKDVLIRTTNSSLKYKVVNNTPLLDKPEGTMIKILNVDDFVTPERIEGEYGLFKTTENISGYVKLAELQPYNSESLTQGISLVNKVIKKDDKCYVLTQGDSVVIKDYVDGKFIIADGNVNEFSVNDNDIELRSAREQVSRSSGSRKSQILSKAVASAYSKLGKPYVYADTGRRGYDCSGLTYSIYSMELGIKIPRSSSEQAQVGTYIDKSELIPGDLLFFNTSGRGISHVGIYIGDGNMIHASSSTAKKVTISTIESGYYGQRYVTARRIVN